MYYNSSGQRNVMVYSFPYPICYVLHYTGRLDSFISHFEELDYGTETLASEHSRIKRETPGYNRFEGDPLRFSFGSHGR